MRILIHSRFYPNLGGVETVAWLLVHEWHRLGESVTVVSDVACARAQRRDLPFAVHYRPDPLRWLRLMRWADVFVHMNISLKAFWPMLIVRRPFVAVNHAYYYSDSEGNRRWRERVKLWLTTKAVNIAVSESVAQRMPASCVVIGNPVELSLFRTGEPAHRPRHLVFVGRLVSDKGCDLLLEALGRLAVRGIRPLLTIIGNGPERSKLDGLVASLNLENQVAFAGSPPSKTVAELLLQHNIMVVPSIYEESFGVVALEGAASGCVVLGSDGGGLQEAIGPAGLTFKRGDAGDLAAKLEWLLNEPVRVEPFRAAAPAHLAKHLPALVAKRYLEVFQQAVLRD